MVERAMATATATVVAGALLLVACVSTDESGSTDGFPAVQIAGIQLVGTAATMTYSAFDGGNDLAITIDWGDGSPLQVVAGQGSQSASHSYDLTITTVTVTVTATDSDGNVGSASRSVALAEAVDTTLHDTTLPDTTLPDTTLPDTTSSGPPASTTTTTTTTTLPPATTSTTTTTTTATTTTTTTTAPPADPVVIALELDDANFDTTERSTDSAARQVDGERLGVLARTGGFGNDPVIASITATWNIPAERFASVGPDPLVSVFFETRSVVELCADDDDFSAAFRLTARATADGEQIGRSEAPVLVHANANGGRCKRFERERATLGFGGPSSGGNVTISLTVRCEAVQPSLAFIDAASCQGIPSGVAVAELREARVTFRPNE